MIRLLQSVNLCNCFLSLASWHQHRLADYRQTRPKYCLRSNLTLIRFWWWSNSLRAHASANCFLFFSSLASTSIDWSSPNLAKVLCVIQPNIGTLWVVILHSESACLCSLLFMFFSSLVSISLHWSWPNLTKVLFMIKPNIGTLWVVIRDSESSNLCYLFFVFSSVASTSLGRSSPNMAMLLFLVQPNINTLWVVIRYSDSASFCNFLFVP